MSADECLVLTVSQAGKLLNLSRGSAYQAIQTGEIPHIRIGRRVLIPKIAILRMLSEAGNKEAETDKAE